MSKDYPLEDLKRHVLNKEQPLGMDELLLSLAEYTGDEDIIKEVGEYVKSWYATFDQCVKMGRALEEIKAIAEEGRKFGENE